MSLCYLHILRTKNQEKEHKTWSNICFIKGLIKHKWETKTSFIYYQLLKCMAKIISK